MVAVVVAVVVVVVAVVARWGHGMGEPRRRNPVTADAIYEAIGPYFSIKIIGSEEKSDGKGAD